MSDKQQLEEIEEIDRDLESKIEEINKFREEMKKRRIEEQIEQENPFALPKTKKIDEDLKKLHEEHVITGQAGVVDNDKINQILEKVKQSLGTD